MRGVVAGGHPETVAAAVQALRAGGNAYDAAVAAGFAAAVAEPGLTSLAGGGFLLAHTAGGDEVLFDFFVDTPGRGLPSGELEPDFTPVTIRFGAADQVFNVGAGSVAAPGCLAGYLHVHRRLGRLEVGEVVGPARRLAAQGVALGANQVAVVRLLEPIFTLRDEGRARYTRDGAVVAPDTPVRNEPLAAFLDEVAEGRIDGFGHPPLAAAIDAQMRRDGGLLTAADLAAYRVVERDPLRAGYRGGLIATNPPPSFGGVLVTHALELLEVAGPAAPFGTGEHLVALADVLERVTRRHVDTGPASRKGTTHISICDAEGNVASMTTSNGSCSGVFLADTGIMANNIMGEEDLHPGGFHAEPPGLRVGSMMAPSVLLRQDGPPVAVGSGGSERIRSALTQVIANLVDHGMSLQEAVDAPRVHWDGRTVQVEPGFDPRAVDALRQVRPVNEWTVSDLYFGGVHAASPSGERAGDVRRGGCTVVVDGHDDR